MRVNFNLQDTQAYTGSSPVHPPGEYLVEIVSGQADQPLRSGKGMKSLALVIRRPAPRLPVGSIRRLRSARVVTGDCIGQ